VSRFRVHTNIPLDFPANRSGKIYASNNIREIFQRQEFRERIEQGALFGTYNYPKLEFPKTRISHVVRDAFISDDMEIMFEIETLRNKGGRELARLLEQSEFSALAKMVARLSKVVVGGKIEVIDIPFVHMVKHEPSYLKKN